jgi:hypothetical protein
MFVKITIAIALVLGTASGALAAPKQKHNASRSHVYDTHRHHSGSASRVKTAHATTVHARTTRAKTAHVKTAHERTKHPAIEAYTTHQSRSGSFERAASALAMANPKSSNRHQEIYYTRAQYTPAQDTRAEVSGSASRAAATAQPRHSSNPAYDVYSIRGWYVGSDPDPTVRSMMQMDPAAVD